MLNPAAMKSLINHRSAKITGNYVPLTVSCDDEDEVDHYSKENTVGSSFFPSTFRPPSPTSPFSPSPRRLRLGCAPDSGLVRESLDDHSEKSSFVTPSTTEQQILVEYLVP